MLASHHILTFIVMVDFSRNNSNDQEKPTTLAKTAPLPLEILFVQTTNF